MKSQNIKYNFDVVQYRVLVRLMLTFVDFFKLNNFIYNMITDLHGQISNTQVVVDTVVI